MLYRLPRLQTNTVEPALPVSPPVVDSQLTASDSRQPALIDHSLSLTTTLSDSLPEISLRSPDLVGVGGSEVEGGGGVVSEMVEESGPVEYSDGEEEEGGFGDADMDELAYEGDPLLYSDGEEGEHAFL